MMQALKEVIVRFGYPLPEHLTKIDSFDKLKELAQLWFIPKSPLLEVVIKADQWTEEVTVPHDNYFRLPLNKHSITQNGLIKDINDLLILEKINPMLTTHLLSTYESLLKLEMTLENHSVVNLTNSLWVLGHFQTHEIVTLCYQNSETLKAEVAAYARKIVKSEELLQFGNNIALLLCDYLIQNNQFNSFIENLFPHNMTYEEFIELDQRVCPIFFHSYLCRQHPEAIEFVTDYLSKHPITTTPNKTVKAIVETLTGFDDLINVMQQYSPLVRLQICKELQAQNLITDLDEYLAFITLMQAPKSILKQFRSAQSEKLVALDKTSHYPNFICHCSQYSNSQLLYAGLYTDHGSNAKTGHVDYLVLLHFRIILGIVKNLVEVVDLLRKLQIASKSTTISIDLELQCNLENSLLCRIIQILKDEKIKTLPACIYTLNLLTIFKENAELYKDIQMLINAKQSLKERCLQVLCNQPNAHAFFAQATIPETLCAEGREILFDRDIVSNF